MYMVTHSEITNLSHLDDIYALQFAVNLKKRTESFEINASVQMNKQKWNGSVRVFVLFLIRKYM